MSYQRYGVYWTPPAGSALADFGASWLGWDADAGRNIPHIEASIEGERVDVAKLTATPRRYGFHGTLKPPFALKGDLADLSAALETIASAQVPIRTAPLHLARHGLSLVAKTAKQSDGLSDLAAACVSRLDRFRAKATPEELRKRRRAGLSQAQEALLQQWGYPYVMGEFQFHLTLTGPLDHRELNTAEAALRPLFTPFETSLDIRDITLVGEATDGRFHTIERFTLSG